jgi:hypothetical protein
VIRVTFAKEKGFVLVGFSNIVNGAHRTQGRELIEREIARFFSFENGKACKVAPDGSNYRTPWLLPAIACLCKTANQRDF